MIIGDSMNKKGFTLVELLAVITLLMALLVLTFPTVLEMIQKKEQEIDQAKLDLIYSAADSYMNNNKNTYPKKVGNIYCISVQTLTDEHLLAFEADDKVLYTNDKKDTLNVVRIAIGKNSKNAYSIPKDGNCSPVLN